MSYEQTLWKEIPDVINPKILKKFLLTTIITTIIFIVIYYLVKVDLLNLREFLQ